MSIASHYLVIGFGPRKSEGWTPATELHENFALLFADTRMMFEACIVPADDFLSGDIAKHMPGTVLFAAPGVLSLEVDVLSLERNEADVCERHLQHMQRVVQQVNVSLPAESVADRSVPWLHHGSVWRYAVPINMSFPAGRYRLCIANLHFDVARLQSDENTTIRAMQNFVRVYRTLGVRQACEATEANAWSARTLAADAAKDSCAIVQSSIEACKAVLRQNALPPKKGRPATTPRPEEADIQSPGWSVFSLPQLNHMVLDLAELNNGAIARPVSWNMEMLISNGLIRPRAAANATLGRERASQGMHGSNSKYIGCSYQLCFDLALLPESHLQVVYAGLQGADDLTDPDLAHTATLEPRLQPSVNALRAAAWSALLTRSGEMCLHTSAITPGLAPQMTMPGLRVLASVESANSAPMLWHGMRSARHQMSIKVPRSKSEMMPASSDPNMRGIMEMLNIAQSRYMQRAYAALAEPSALPSRETLYQDCLSKMTPAALQCPDEFNRLPLMSQCTYMGPDAASEPLSMATSASAASIDEAAIAAMAATDLTLYDRLERLERELSDLRGEVHHLRKHARDDASDEHVTTRLRSVSEDML